MLRCRTCQRVYHHPTRHEHGGARTYSSTTYDRVDVDMFIRSDAANTFVTAPGNGGQPVFRRDGHFARGRPLKECIERGAEGLAPWGQAVLDARRTLGMSDASKDSVLLELAKLLVQHLLRDSGQRPFELGEPLNPTPEQLEQDP